MNSQTASNKFKIGDTVERINSRNGGLNPGDRFIIHSFICGEAKPMDGPSHMLSNLKLVKSASKPIQIY
jgi:hypothetical protein